MIFALAGGVLVFEIVLAVFGLHWPWFPDLYAALLIAIAMRSTRDRDLPIAVGLGFLLGAFSSLPWAFRPLLGLICVSSVALMRRTVSTQALVGRTTITWGTLLILWIAEVALRRLMNSPLDVRVILLGAVRIVTTATVVPIVVSIIDVRRLAVRL